MTHPLIAQIANEVDDTLGITKNDDQETLPECLLDYQGYFIENMREEIIKNILRSLLAEGVFKDLENSGMAILFGSEPIPDAIAMSMVSNHRIKYLADSIATINALREELK